MELKIGIYDDNPAFAGELKNACAQGLASAGRKPNVTVLTDKQVQDWSDGVSSKGDTLDDPWKAFNVLVLDFDLAKTDFAKATRLASSIRTRSRFAGPIIFLNVQARRTFDLDLRLAGVETWSDMHCWKEDLASQNFWAPKFSAGYCPTYWPVMDDLATRYPRMVEEALGGLDDSVANFFGIPPEAVSAILDAKLAKPVYDLDKTVRSFAERKNKDADFPAMDDQGLARVAAAKLHHWINNIVLPSQNVLVDAPHLVARYPSLFGKEVASQEFLNRLARAAPDDKTLKGVAPRHRFSRVSWVARPTWWVHSLMSDYDISEVDDPASHKDLGWVLAEDLSVFVKEAGCEGYQVAGEPPSPRHVAVGKHRDGIEYEPAGRLARRPGQRK